MEPEKKDDQESGVREESTMNTSIFSDHDSD